MMTKQESQAINSVRFICIIALVLLHTRVAHLATPSAVVLLERVQDLISLPFLSILFLLSGYLFFCKKRGEQSPGTWPGKLRKRVKTLLVPYVIWCAVSIAYNHCVKHEPLPGSIGDFLMLFWDAGSGHPIGRAMWYVKSLIVFSLMAPLYYKDSEAHYADSIAVAYGSTHSH